MHVPYRVSRKKTLAFIKVGVLFLSLVGVVIFAHAFEMQGILSPDWADAHLKEQGRAGILLFLALAAVFSALGMPRQAISALGGYAFGVAAGILWTSAGVTLGCISGFFYARLLGRASVQQRLGKGVARLDAFLTRNPVLMTIALRLFPFSSNGLTNMAAGVTSIPAPAFITGSAIGYLPQTIIFALLGSGIRVDPVWRTTISALLFVLSSLLGLYLFKRYRADCSLPDPQGDATAPEHPAFPPGTR